MKKIFYLILIVVSSSMYSCTVHEDCCTVAQPPAKVTAQKNGTAWTPLFAKGTLSNSDTLSISATTATYQATVLNKVDSLNITFLYNAPGTYKLSGNEAFYGVFNGSNITGYQLDGTYNNVINITGYQRMTDPYTTVPDQVKITGTFNIKFIDPKNPAGISFQSGSFYAMVPYL